MVFVFVLAGTDVILFCLICRIRLFVFLELGETINHVKLDIFVIGLVFFELGKMINHVKLCIENVDQ